MDTDPDKAKWCRSDPDPQHSPLPVHYHASTTTFHLGPPAQNTMTTFCFCIVYHSLKGVKPVYLSPARRGCFWRAWARTRTDERRRGNGGSSGFPSGPSRTSVYNWNTIKCWNISQCFGSGSGLDPDSIRSVDPYPDSESGSGSRRVKMIHKSGQKWPTKVDKI